MIIRALSLLACAAALLACSSNDNTGKGHASGSGATSSSGGGGSGNGNNGSGNNGNGADQGAANASGSGAAPGIIFSSGGASSGAGASSSAGGNGDTATGVCGGSDLSGCVGDRYAGEQIPLDIYIMFDVSCSMSCPAEETGPGLCCRGGPNPRIDQVRSAVTSFLNDPASDGIGVGIGYFGYMPGGQTSCDPSRYSAPSVPIAPLPGNAAAVIASLNAAQPIGETPTGAAIRGACTYASQSQAMNPGHKTVVLLVTDGFPEAPTTSMNGGCTPTIQDAVAAATTCSSHDPSLPVYVLGVGMQLTNLGDIATAGGTKMPFVVGGAAITQQIIDALNQIRALAQIPCHIKLPPPPSGTALKLDQVNVGSCASGGQGQVFSYVMDQSSCDPSAGGWYYDDPNTPKQIVLCSATCTAVNTPGVSLFASVGCQTQTIIR
jgi:hypothetical protein